MQKYVLGFMFSPDYKNVLLIEKNRPEWQRGKINGVGGKVGNGERYENAMVREFQEETGVTTLSTDWNWLCQFGDDTYLVEVFWTTSEDWNKAESITDETIFKASVALLNNYSDSLLPNVKWMVPLAIDKVIGFSGKIITTMNSDKNVMVNPFELIHYNVGLTQKEIDENNGKFWDWEIKYNGFRPI
jgi:8-oxo-dGTP diphosphatase